MRPAFRYFGCKQRIADEIWRRLGDPAHYFEPFAGSLATLLARPTLAKHEYVGDTDCMIANFFRAAKNAPAKVALHAEYPPSSIDLKGRIRWLEGRRKTLEHDLLSDPEYFDAKCAGWYAWMQSVRVHNGNSVCLGTKAGVCRPGESTHGYFARLAERLQNVTIYHGDWGRLARAALRLCRASLCAALLDPPYKIACRDIYHHGSKKVCGPVKRWAVAAASPKLRIALCGYEGDYDMPKDWTEIPWKGRFVGQRERIWFSPHCLDG